MKTVLITGAFGTIGKGLRDYLKGYDLILHDYKSRLEGSIGGDLAQSQGIEECVEEVKKRTTALYAIVHTVGSYHRAPLEETTGKEWMALFQNNVISAAELAKHLKPQVFISFGVAGMDKPAYLMPAYLACKCALMSLTKSLCLTGIRANMICPGSVEGSPFAIKGPQVQSEEIAKLVAFLLSVESVTGQVIDIAQGIR